jgi:hemerythrin-like domain-containing protein
MAAALAQIEEGDPSAANALFESAKNYLRLLREHIQKEDEILFPMADQTLGEAVQKQMLMAFAEHEAVEMGAGAHEKYLSIAEELSAAV